eukprot:g7500.t1
MLVLVCWAFAGPAGDAVAAASAPVSAAEWSAFAQQHFAAGRLQQAEVSWQRALRLRPQDADVATQLGFVRYQAALTLRGAERATQDDDDPGASAAARKLELAAGAFRLAGRLSPRAAMPQAGLGASLSRLHRSTEAVTAFASAVRAAPTDGNLRYNHGVALKQADRLAEAEAALRASAALYSGQGGQRDGESNRELADVLYELAMVLTKRGGRLREAKDAYVAAIRAHPASAEAHGNLGMLLYYTHGTLPAAPWRGGGGGGGSGAVDAATTMRRALSLARAQQNAHLEAVYEANIKLVLQRREPAWAAPSARMDDLVHTYRVRPAAGADGYDSEAAAAVALRAAFLRSQNPRDCASARYLVLLDDEQQVGLGFKYHYIAQYAMWAMAEGRVLVEAAHVSPREEWRWRWCGVPPYSWQCYVRPWSRCEGRMARGLGLANSTAAVHALRMESGAGGGAGVGTRGPGGTLPLWRREATLGHRVVAERVTHKAKTNWLIFGGAGIDWPASQGKLWWFAQLLAVLFRPRAWVRREAEAFLRSAQLLRRAAPRAGAPPEWQDARQGRDRGRAAELARRGRGRLQHKLEMRPFVLVHMRMGDNPFRLPAAQYFAPVAALARR